MKLFVVRHGDAGPHVPDPVAERDRELTDVGEEMAAALAKFVKALDIQPKIILASNYTRTQQTADIIGKKLGVHVDLLDQLSPNMPLRPMVEALAESPRSKRVMLVGHTDNLCPLFNELGGNMGDCGRDSDEDDDVANEDGGPWPHLFKAECRYIGMDRKTLEWECRARFTPSDAGLPDMLD